MGLISHVAQEHSEGGISEDSVKVNVSKSVKQLKVQLKGLLKRIKVLRNCPVVFVILAARKYQC